MKTGPDIIRAFVFRNDVNMADFREWFEDAGLPEEEANHHDSRYLQRLMQYVEERDSFLE